MKRKDITLTWKSCELLANYYEFPVCMFEFNEASLKRQLKGTRKKNLTEAMRKFMRGDI